MHYKRENRKPTLYQLQYKRPFDLLNRMPLLSQTQKEHGKNSNRKLKTKRNQSKHLSPCHSRFKLRAVSNPDRSRQMAARASSTLEIESQIRELTSEILTTHEKASKPATLSELPFVQDVPSWRYPRNLELPRVSSPGFGYDYKMMVMLVDVTAQVAPELQRRMRTGIWQLLPKETDGAQHQTCLFSSSATDTTVSRQTMYRRLGYFGLYARRCVRCVPLTATHCRLRLTWSREHALWIPQQWSCVMFSDESRFSFQSGSRQTLIWRTPGTSYQQENTIERHRYGGAGWLDWGGIILGSRTDLHVQSVRMTGHIYRDVILEQHVRLFRGAMGTEFLFMDDTPVLTMQTLLTNAFNWRISPLLIGQHTHRT
ncbi:HTH_Tnp_Tc3_2 domain-containing protein [Trichonephila clavipes]|nr:HTH_Tnp_Tc3_2 domain-containing protein [Trichonephila clavipes]